MSRFPFALIVLLPLVSGADESTPAIVREALARAVAAPEYRVEVEAYLPARGKACDPERAEAGPIKGSGRIAVHMWGRDESRSLCETWAWTIVRVTARVWVLTRPLADGDPFTDALREESREVRAGHEALLSLPTDAVASRSLLAGTALRSEHLRVGPPLGGPVTVRLVMGEIRLEKPGRRSACSGGRFCAALANGKHVEGRWDGQALWVETR